MEQGRFLFPDTVVQFPVARRAAAKPRPRGHLSGEGLANRLRQDVERQIAHRRRMLAHLQSQASRSA